MVTQWRLMVGAALAAPPVPGTSIRRLAVRGVASVRGKIEKTAPPHRPAKKPSQARDPLPRRISRANPDSAEKCWQGLPGFQSRFEFGNLRCTTLLRGQWPGNAIACPRGKIMPKQAKSRLDTSLEEEKLKNDFLIGVAAIVEAIRSGKIQCRVYKKDKFHAKAYITHARQEVAALSSATAWAWARRSSA